MFREIDMGKAVGIIEVFGLATAFAALGYNGIITKKFAYLVV